MTDKELALDTVRQLPEWMTMEEIAEEVTILASIRRGEQDARKGRIHSADEVKKMLSKWVTNNLD